MQSVSGISRVSGVRRFSIFNRLWIVALVAAVMATGIDLLIASASSEQVDGKGDRI